MSGYSWCREGKAAIATSCDLASRDTAKSYIGKAKPTWCGLEIFVLELWVPHLSSQILRHLLALRNSNAVTMSTAKRSRRRQAEAQAASPTQPASKRLKTAKDSHVPARGGLSFLVDEEARPGKKVEARLTNGTPKSKATRVDDSQAVIAQTQNSSKVGTTKETALEISSAESSSSDGDSEEDDEDIAVKAPGEKTMVNGMSNGHGGAAEMIDGSEAGAEDVESVDADMRAVGSDGEDSGEPTFGDLLQARHPEQIDIRASFPDPLGDRQALIPFSGLDTLAIPSGTSLVTVLTQALKTNDKAQLESCLQQSDIPTIKATIQRLQSQYVATLLQRVAERIHKRPGRTGSLLIWVQWSLVAHGAYLATQPDVMARLRALSQVLKERASGLQSLLHLKGKLDMLAAQLDMRRSIQAASRARADAEDEDDEEGVVYVEGQEDDDWSSEEDAVAGAAPIQSNVKGIRDSGIPKISSRRPKLQTATPNTNPSAFEGDSSDDDVPNGVVQEGDDEESSDAEEMEDEGMFEVEAEETDDDSGEEASSEEEDSEPESESELSDDDESDLSDGVKAPNPKTLNRKR